MLRFLLRLAAGLALAGSFAQVVVDGARWIAGGRLALTPLEDLLTTAAPGRVEALAGALEAASPWASRVLGAVLATPAFVDLAALAVLLLLAANPAREDLDEPRAGRRA